MSNPATPAKITAADVENKLRAFQGQIQGKVDDKKSTIVSAGAGAVTILMLLMFLLGKRSGKKKSTIVQIKRL
ncbi:MAG TPA: hypothetical protein VNQ73_22715 [Ilumatobacter sp.]|nr:hypothetical protein [Ilumatobacter sp.]